MSRPSIKVGLPSTLPTVVRDVIQQPLGALVAIAGLGYATDSLGATLAHGSWTPFSSFTFLGEFLLALWLLIRARRIAATASQAPAS